jgi:hypothetical protein
MADVGELTLATFADYVGDTFRIRISQDNAIEVTLSEATAAGEAPAPDQRAPFSIIFSGPTDPILPQAIYAIEHDAIEAVELFLVPLQPDAGGARYQAVFN